MSQTERHRPRHRVEKLRRRVGKGIPRERSERDSPDAVLRAIDRCLREQDHVAACQVYVFVWRVERGRLPTQRPVRRRIEVANRECEMRERCQRGKRRRGEKSMERLEFLCLPRKAGADVDWLNVGTTSFRRREYRAVKSRG